MPKTKNVDSKIKILKLHPNLFNISLKNYVKTNAFKKLKENNFNKFGDLAKLRSIEEIHMKAKTTINHALIVLFKEKNIIYGKEKAKEKKSRLSDEIKLSKMYDNSKIFTIKEFDEIVNKLGFRNKKYIDQKAEFDSIHEKIFAKKLEKLNFVKVIRQIHLCTYKSKGKIKNYYPDFIALDKMGHIFVIEVKEYTAMATRDTLVKYYFAKKYCKQNGFIYLLTTLYLTTYEDIASSCIDKKIKNFIKETIQIKGKFTKIDLDKLRVEMKNKNRRYIDKQIVRICIQNDYLMKGGLIYSTKSLCIKPHNL